MGKGELRIKYGCRPLQAFVGGYNSTGIQKLEYSTRVKDTA